MIAESKDEQRGIKNEITGEHHTSSDWKGASLTKSNQVAIRGLRRSQMRPMFQQSKERRE
jgi:Spy/CpxP family protein refolding chaperone